MTYYINFALNIKKDNSNIIYDSESFTEQPILITTPVLIKIIDNFKEGFEKVGIVDKDEDKSFLKPLSGEAFIYQVKDLDEKYLNQANKHIAQRLSTCLSGITADNLYSEELTVPFSEVKEIMELRNYLLRYVITKKKNFQKGYMVIMQ